MDITASARPRNGLTIQGGCELGPSTADSCEIRDKVPETAPSTPGATSSPDCSRSTRPSAPTSIPKVGRPDRRDVHEQAGHPGQPVRDAGRRRRLAANYTVANAVVAQSLGRNLSGNAPNVTVNLIEPHTLLGDRVNEMDIRVGKIVRFGGSR